MRVGDTVDVNQSAIPLKSRLKGLDALRGVAAVMVVLGHALYYASLDGLSHHAFGFLGRGVQLFYVLSGYILCEMYMDMKWDYRGTVNFFIKRFFRIAPLFYIVIVSVAVTQMLPVGEWLMHLSLLGFGFSKAHVNSILGVEWSIHVECWFYVFFPILLFLAKLRPVLFLLSAIFLSVLPLAFLSVVSEDIGLKTFVYNQPFSQVSLFAVGMYLSIRPQARALIQHFSILAVIAGFILLFVPSLLNMPFLVQFSLSIPASALLVAYAASDFNNENFIIKSLSWLGDISYSVYLIHMPIMLTVIYILGDDLIDSTLARIALLMLPVFPCAWITYRCIEMPGISLGRRLARSVGG